MNDNELMNTATELLKQQQWKEAGTLFRQVWENENNAYSASRYLYCLRKGGYPSWSIKQGNKAFNQFPGNKYIKNELVWAYYDDGIKPEASKENLYQLIESAKIILSLQPDVLPKELTVFAVIKAAKQKEKWDIVLEWCNVIKPEDLSDESIPVDGDGRTGKSKKEQWFFAKVKSLIELELWKEARACALEAIKIYPREMNFYRFSALALANLGEEEKAILELQDILLKHREEWYIYQDLSDIYLRINQPETAIKFACQAALSPGEDKIKVTLYEKICQQSLLLGKLEMSAQHLELCKAIREREGWKVKDTLQQLQAEINQEITNQQSTFTKFEGDITKLNQICRKFWKEILYQDIPRYCGTIESLPPNQAHGWIIDDTGNRVFFLQKELPKFLRKEKQRVSFILQESYDRKRDRKSFKAADFQIQKP
ncbi:MAG: tetratricopeptide repeat protein [Sphaerospermopsis kisseleviana]